MRYVSSTASARRGAAVPSVVGLLALACASVAAADTPATSDPPTYAWSAELVAFDKATNTVTVKSRLVSEAPSVAGLKPGDAVMLTWSGVSTAVGVRAVERGAKSGYDRMTMPVVYVSYEQDGRSVSFKVPIPATDAAAIERVQPGQYVTATSPQHPKNAKEAVVAIRPYADAG
ncbi:MAG TPA: hypothetical protein VE907_09930 [Gammaproteobacteria bacterium]|nr:hypothetical protein [Gammaproteobacteria bacterium]